MKLILLVTVSWGWLAVSASSASAQEQPQASVSVVGPASIAIADTGDSVTLLSSGPDQIISAVSSDGQVGLSFESETSACPAPARATVVQTEDPVTKDTGVELFLATCGRLLDGTSATVAVWGASDSRPISLEVTFGTKPPSVDIGAPAKIVIDGGDHARNLHRDLCTSKAPTGVVGFVTRRDHISPVTANERKATPCPEGTTGVRLTFSVRGGSGAYIGQLDLNGAAEGGSVELTANRRAGVFPFIAVSSIGLAFATLLSWWLRFGRGWGYVDEVESAERARMSLLQTQVAEMLGAGWEARFAVVSPTPPSTPTRALDQRLATYAGTKGWLRRHLSPPPADKMVGGKALETLMAQTDAYQDMVATARRLHDWLVQTPCPAGAPTKVAIRSALYDPPTPGPDNDLTPLLDSLKAVGGIAATYLDLANQIRVITAADPSNQGQVDVLKAAARTALDTTLLNEDGVKTVNGKIAQARLAASNGDDAPRSGVDRRRVELLDVDSVAQAVTARGASSIRVSTTGWA